MKINIFRSGLKRADLEHVCYFIECDKTLAYAEEKMSVNGVSEYYKKMKVEKSTYISDINSIVDPEMESEEKEYLLLKKWEKIRQISAWTCIGTFIIGIICLMYRLSETIAALFFLLALVAFLAFVIAKIGETVCGIIYKRHIRDIMEKILAREKQFVVLCQRYYKEIDDLFLHSLSLLDQEMLLRDRRREEKEELRLKSQERMENEQKQMRRIQQGILDNLDEWRDERHGLK